jgi:hypothetical protein
MSRPPLLNPAIAAGPMQPRYALLINPFYPKDPNASFGKHVLTPSLLIKHHLVHAAWRPMVELTRLRHIRFRAELAASETLSRQGVNVVPAGV